MATANKADTRQKSSNRITTLAFRKLRDAHADEYQQLRVEAAEELGIEYTPKPTKAQKAQQQLAELLSDNPDLRAQLVNEIEQQIKVSAEVQNV